MSTASSSEGHGIYPNELFRVRDLGDHSDPYWFAASDDGTVLAQPGEHHLWTGWVNGAVTTSGMPELEHALLIVTDRRLMWSSNGFDQGTTYTGFGVIGAAASLAATVRSNQKAKKRREGRVLLGQIRFEWITAVALKCTGQPGRPKTRLVIEARAASGPRGVGFRADPPFPFDFAEWLVRTISTARLSDATYTGAEQRQLEEHAAGGQVSYVETLPRDFVWRLPEVTESSIRAGRDRLSSMIHRAS